MNHKRTARFRRAVKRIAKRGKNLQKLLHIIPRIYYSKLTFEDKDHALQGNWVGHRECHIEPNWLLVYRWEGDTLVLVDMGSHTDLFGS